MECTSELISWHFKIHTQLCFTNGLLRVPGIIWYKFWSEKLGPSSSFLKIGTLFMTWKFLAYDFRKFSKKSKSVGKHARAIQPVSLRSLQLGDKCVRDFRKIVAWRRNGSVLHSVAFPWACVTVKIVWFIYMGVAWSSLVSLLGFKTYMIVWYRFCSGI